MKIFFGGTFIEKEKLKEAGIDHPIKLEYYKIINEDEITREEKYGVSVVKTEYLQNDIKVEDKTIKYISSSEIKINNLLNKLKINEVTPITVQDIIYDFSKT